jgi:hypothetical protein
VSDLVLVLLVPTPGAEAAESDRLLMAERPAGKRGGACGIRVSVALVNISCFLLREGRLERATTTRLGGQGERGRRLCHVRLRMRVHKVQVHICARINLPVDVKGEPAPFLPFRGRRLC